jgi:hypothetical protein
MKLEALNSFELLLLSITFVSAGEQSEVSISESCRKTQQIDGGSKRIKRYTYILKCSVIKFFSSANGK